MKIARKLLLPVLFFSTLLAGSVVLINLYFSRSSLRIEETRQAENLYQALRLKFSSLEDLALGLATQTAENPQVQEAFAAGDRQRLVELTLPAYEQINQQFDVPQHQFHLPPATSFLRLHELDNFGDDLSALRFTVLQANEEKILVAGLEIGRGGLGMRGVVPVQYQGTHIGTVEFGLNVDQTLLQEMKAQYGSDWQILLRQDLARIATFESASGQTPLADTALILQTSTLSQPLFASPAVYSRVLNGEKVITRTRSGNAYYSIYSTPLQDFSGRVIGVAEIISDRSPFVRAQASQLSLAALFIVASLLFGAMGLYVIISRTLHPVRLLTQHAAEVADGDFNRASPVNSKDEIGDLSRAFNSMTHQLRELIGGLEQRVSQRTFDLERRTSQLQASAEVTREITSAQDLEGLLTRAANLIRERFGFYHVGIFLVDEMKEYAYLRAATGDAGRRMLAEGRREQINGEGIIAYVISRNQTLLSQDSGSGETVFSDPALPDTHSQLTLPLVAGSRIVGALDVQSASPSAFDKEDTSTLQALADQLAVSIENIRLVERVESALKEINAFYQQQVKTAWKDITLQDRNIAFEYDRLAIKPMDHPLPADVIARLEAGQVVILDAAQINHAGNGHSRSTLIAPLLLRDQMIGSIGIESDDPEHFWTDEEIATVQAAAAQAALTLENARLLEQSRHRADRERLVAEITARMRQTLDIDTVLKTAALEMRRALNLKSAEVRLGPPQPPSDADKEQA
jgi:GAF domain-containing protein/HAMP domain-containing protein